MIKTAYLQDPGGGRLRLEERLLRSEFERRGVPVVLYTLKHIRRRALPLSPETFIAGDMEAMHGAMRQLDIEVPPPDDYPASLQSFLHRRVWKARLGDVERAASEGMAAPVFVKPAARRKSFTGRVFRGAGDFMRVGGTSRRQDVWCSQVVNWRSEFRLYVVGQRISALDHYAGDPGVGLDLEVVESALAAYRASGRAPSAYGIDFGVLDTGETALVEANDGYALGAYDVAAGPYTDLLLTRWCELLGSRHSLA